MAATPMAMPSADSPARSFRVRSPTVESRVRSESCSRLRLRVAVAVTTAPRAGRAPVSATIWPSRISTLRGIRSAMAWSWVMTTIVEPAWWSWSIRARMDCPVAWSRFPVGSSASTMAGWPTRARAIATRWRCPPESWVGRAWGRCGQADQLEGVEGALAALLEGDAGVEEPVGDVVQHGGVLGQEELLEDEPDPGGPQVGHVLVGHRGHVEPGDPHPAAGGPVEGPHQLQQGGLARPRGADDPDQLPRADGEVHLRAGPGRAARRDSSWSRRRHRAPAPLHRRERSRCRPRPRCCRVWVAGCGSC